ncbi:MAG TPA: hypothetical protein VGR71_04395 [Nitrospira sp.]|nr:hypothetical protein [Nitrospira sp.]
MTKLEDITRATDTDEASDARVLNSILEEWEDLEGDARRTISFPDALRSYREELVELLAHNDGSPGLLSELRKEQEIIDGWLAEFAEMHQRLTEV